MECYNCGVSLGGTRLYDAISDEGIKKICEKCAREEHIPVIRRPTTYQLKEAEEQKSFYQRASESKRVPIRRVASEEITLREIVDRNYEKKVPKNMKPRPEMVQNFHWVIMRARRMKKLTQEQLAKELQESVSAIKMAEEGILPEDDYRLVNKLESFLGINIIRNEFANRIRPQNKALSFDMQEMRELTIEDLKRMKERKEKLSQELSKRDFPDEFSGLEDEDEFDSDDINISQEEMDRIIFGR